MSSPAPTEPARMPLGEALAQLTKARLTVLVLLTTLAGYGLASAGPFDWPKLLHTLLGTTLAAVCSSILNQAWERDTDALMRRTRERPLVTRRFPLTPTVLAGLGLGALGLAELALFVNRTSLLLTFATVAIYVLFYTPLKRLTPLNTLVGAIPGALPPLIGAVAARGHFSAAGWSLFAILALWQLPHFYAIAWLYREDYAAAGLRMVSVRDTLGRRTGWHALVSAVLLFPASLLPTLLGVSSWFYGAIAALLSAGFVVAAVFFARKPDHARARALFGASILYLPLVLTVLALDIPVSDWLRR